MTIYQLYLNTGVPPFKKITNWNISINVGEKIRVDGHTYVVTDKLHAMFEQPATSNDVFVSLFVRPV